MAMRQRVVEVSGKTVDEAVQRALEQLALDRDRVDVEVIREAKGGFLGFGSEDAIVRVTARASAPAPAEPAREPRHLHLPAQAVGDVRGRGLPRHRRVRGEDDLADAILRFADLRKSRSRLSGGGSMPVHLSAARRKDRDLPVA